MLQNNVFLFVTWQITWLLSGSRSCWKFSCYAPKVWTRMPPKCLHLSWKSCRNHFFTGFKELYVHLLYVQCVYRTVCVCLKLHFHVELPVQLFNIRKWIIVLKLHSGGKVIFARKGPSPWLKVKISTFYTKILSWRLSKGKHFYTIMANQTKRGKTERTHSGSQRRSHCFT